MKTHLIADSVRYPTMTTAQIRDAFLIDALYEPGALNLAYVDLDRAVVGMAAPSGAPSRCPLTRRCARITSQNVVSWGR